MKNKIPLALTLCSTLIARPLQANEGHQWRAIAFGQSTDSNFSSNVLPEKIGVNDVTIAGKKLTPQDSADLSQPMSSDAAQLVARITAEIPPRLELEEIVVTVP